MNRDLTTSQGSMLPSPPADQSMLAVHLRLSRVHTLDEQLQALMEIIIESLAEWLPSSYTTRRPASSTRASPSARPDGRSGC